MATTTVALLLGRFPRIETLLYPHGVVAMPLSSTLSAEGIDRDELLAIGDRMEQQIVADRAADATRSPLRPRK